MKYAAHFVRWFLLLAAIAGMVFLLTRSFWAKWDVKVMDFLNRGVLKSLNTDESPPSPVAFESSDVAEPETSSNDAGMFAGKFGLIRITLTLLLSTLLGAVVALRSSQNRTERSPIMEAHMILAVAASLMMMIIGSQLARAFGLMGAASIVRYRYSLRNPREGSSLIIALGVGMACGTGLYVLAAVTALLVQLIFRLPGILPQWARGSMGGEMNHYELTLTSSDMEETIRKLEERTGKLHGVLNINRIREKEGKTSIQARLTLPVGTREEDFTKGLLGNEVKVFEWENMRGKKE